MEALSTVNAGTMLEGHGRALHVCKNLRMLVHMRMLQ